MTISFPNPCRSFDAVKNRVQFWGYDRAFEVSFHVNAEALQKLCPEMNNAESGLLKAFDAAIDRIHEVAAATYTSGRKGVFVYHLAAADFSR